MYAPAYNSGNNKLIDELRDLPRSALSISWTDRFISVPQGKGYVSEIYKPVGTSGLNTCVAIVAIDYEKKKQGVAHADFESSIENMSSFLNAFSKSSRVYLLEGYTPSEVLLNAYAAAKNSGMKSITLLDQELSPYDFGGTSVVSIHGNLYSVHHQNQCSEIDRANLITIRKD